ncbi:Fe2+-dependent dioxygenase [Methylonatrum kenyense]|uniref:Fe2+-dependent dioxygenase n=1 Tax=Methylonatrum kenyense TaxID=455253 RepID=UPI0020BDC4A8|nr:Fe2+-dependent dioxygenase [Methylonatrum kenyense]MCK8515072.1 Fe2+-dependent dioxygenase [Methylonatrum kenyense]
MILSIPNVLSSESLASIRESLASAPFVDGRLTASEQVGSVKNNLQLDEQSALHAELAECIRQAVLDNAFFQIAAWPKVLQPFRFNRYETGMGYGRHVDDPICQGVRSDISMTLFLSDPDSYDGGELVIELGGDERSAKLAAGNMVIYPSTTLHRVEPVTRGTRLGAVNWCQSYIRDAARRELIFELDMARRSLFKRDGKSGEFDSVSNALANLLRMWSDT